MATVTVVCNNILGIQVAPGAGGASPVAPTVWAGKNGGGITSNVDAIFWANWAASNPALTTSQAGNPPMVYAVASGS